MHDTLGEPKSIPSSLSVPLSAPIPITLRRSILAGICLCVITMAYSIHRYPGIVTAPAAPKFLPLFLAGVLWYGLAAVRWTRATTPEDLVVLHYGARWGVVIGLVWIVEVVAGDLILPSSPIALFATLIAVVLPAVAGATGVAVTGRIRTGARIGFWSGVVSGLITFIAVAGVGYVAAYFPESLHGADTPPDISRTYTAAELATYNLADYLAGGVSHLLIVGALLCTAAGALGGLFGRVVRSPRADWLNH